MVDPSQYSLSLLWDHRSHSELLAFTVFYSTIFLSTIIIPDSPDFFCPLFDGHIVMPKRYRNSPEGQILSSATLQYLLTAEEWEAPMLSRLLVNRLWGNGMGIKEDGGNDLCRFPTVFRSGNTPWTHALWNFYVFMFYGTDWIGSFSSSESIIRHLKISGA